MKWSIAEFFNRIKSTLVCVVLTLGVVACSKAPDPQNDIPLFKAFIAENIDKVSDDLYISSAVKPGDKMYEFLKYVQPGSGRNLLIQSLVDDGDPEAMHCMREVRLIMRWTKARWLST
ncbi:TPA: hypothetical protein ACN30O_004618 [Vibrio parahaemolyticus]